MQSFCNGVLPSELESKLKTDPDFAAVLQKLEKEKREKEGSYTPYVIGGVVLLAAVGGVYLYTRK